LARARLAPQCAHPTHSAWSPHLALQAKMCGSVPLVAPGPALPMDTVGKSAEKPAGHLRLEIASAVSGEVLLPSATAASDWTVRRLKLSIARGVGVEASQQHLLFVGRLLSDSELVSSVLPSGEEITHTLTLIRSLPQVAAQPCTRTLIPDPQVTVSSEDGLMSSVRWRVDSRILKRTDKQLTSPTFELNLGVGLERIPFKLSIFARGSMSFMKCNGWGYMQLKCLQDLPKAAADFSLTAWASPSSDEADRTEDAMATSECTQEHCFATSAAARLPRRQAAERAH